MKLVPLFGFLSRKRVVEDDEDVLEELIAEQIKLPTEEIVESEEDEAENEEVEELAESEDMGNMSPSTDEMLKVFVATEEEFMDTSSLVTEVEDIPVAELLIDLRQIAAAFNIRPQIVDGE